MGKNSQIQQYYLYKWFTYAGNCEVLRPLGKYVWTEPRTFILNTGHEIPELSEGIKYKVDNVSVADYIGEFDAEKRVMFLIKNNIRESVWINSMYFTEIH